MNERVNRYLVAWGRNALALLLCLVVGGGAVAEAESAGWIYTRGWHTAWVTAVLFLSYLSWRDVRRDRSPSKPEGLQATADR
jgi:hypothetical protein